MKKNDGKKMLKYFKPLKVSFIILTFLMIILCLINVVNPILSVYLLSALADINVDKSIMLALCMMLIGIIKIIIDYFSKIIYLKKVKQKLVLNLRKDMIKNSLNNNLGKRVSKDFINRIKKDTDQFSTTILKVKDSLIDLITSIIILLYIFYMNYILGIIYFISFVITFVYEEKSLKYSKIMSEQIKTEEDKLFNKTIYEVNNKKNINTIVKKLEYSTNLENEDGIKTNALYNLTQLIQGITVLLIIIVGIYYVKDEVISATNLIIIYIYKSNVFDLSINFRNVQKYLNEYSSACKRIFEYMDNKK